LKNLTLTGGSLTKNSTVGSAFGCGLYNVENLILSNCAVSGNTMVGANAKWGYGMGIYNSGDCTLSGCRVENNTSTLSRTIGAGIYHASGTMRIINSVVSGNLCNNEAGGIKIGGILHLINSSVIGNRCNTPATGAGIRVGDSGQLHALGSVIAVNADQTGAVGGKTDLYSAGGAVGLAASLVSDPIEFGSTNYPAFIDQGGNRVGTAYESENFDGSAINAGTEKGTVVYTDGTNYYASCVTSNCVRVTPETDVAVNARESGSIDMGAFEYQFSGSEIAVFRYDEWTAACELPSADCDWNVDPDGDGLINLWEYCSGGTPDVPDAETFRPRQAVIEIDGTQWVEYLFRFRRDAAERGVYHVVEQCDDLRTGYCIWCDCTFVDRTPLDASYEEVRVTVPVDLNCGFIRLRFGFSE
jgi:hypothetical protein